jgi:hypothetical protein
VEHEEAVAGKGREGGRVVDGRRQVERHLAAAADAAEGTLTAGRRGVGVFTNHRFGRKVTTGRFFSLN